jgi:hypothetical protein
MTVSVNGKPDVLTTSEVWELCKAHNQLDLRTDQVGALYVGEEIDPALLEQEARAIMAARPDLNDACSRVLAALGKTPHA